MAPVSSPQVGQTSSVASSGRETFSWRSAMVPSTYSPTISTLMDRKYVRLDRKRFYPEDVGIVVTDLLADVFPKVIDLGFTAEMEEDLDRIASGAKPWEPVVKTFFV